MTHTSEDYPKFDKAKLKLPFNVTMKFLLRQDLLPMHALMMTMVISSVHAWARGVGHGITSDRGLGRRNSPDLHSLTKNTSLQHYTDRDFLHVLLEQRRWAIVWTIVFLFAERNFRLCVNRNFDAIFGPVLPEPNRIFGLLNLSIIKAKTIPLPGLFQTRYRNPLFPSFSHCLSSAPDCDNWLPQRCSGKIN